MIAIQCGNPAVVSVPNGAPAERIDDPVNSNRYRFLWESQADLERVKSFVLATDSDGPGLTLAHDLAAILGPERCRFVTYPDDCKDLNEVFIAHGLRGVNEKINRAKPFRSEEHTSELQSLMRISYAVFCLNNNNKTLT